MSCPDCFQGAIMTDYQPKGTMQTLHGRQTYIARPPNGATPKGIVIIIPDAFGQPFPNNKHLADEYAARGPFLVYLPEFMDGHSAPSWLVYSFPQLFATATWWDLIRKPYDIATVLYAMAPFIYHNGFGKSMPRVQAYFEAVRDNEATQQNLPIGSAGFCWGGQHVFALATGEYKSSKSGKVLCDAHFGAHVSNVSGPPEAKKVKLPLSMAAATDDKVLSLAKAREVEAVLREKADKEGLKHSEVQYYEGAGHGFAVRADPMDKKLAEHAEGATDQAVQFYRRVFADWKGAS